MGRLAKKIQGLSEIRKFDNSFEIILRRIFFKKTGIITYRLPGMEVVVDHHGGDEVGTRACLATDMYTRLLPELRLSSPINVLDIGANGGGFGLMLADAGLQIGKIAAVEMNPRTFARMQLNIVQNIAANYALMNAAVCGTSQMLTVELGQGSTGETIDGRIRDASSGRGRRVATIEGLTFDQVFDRAFSEDELVDICKIDIEGSEYDIFDGNDYNRLSRCRNIVIEIHGVTGKDPKIAIDAITQKGFSRVAEGSSHPDVYLFRNDNLPARQAAA